MTKYFLFLFLSLPKLSFSQTEDKVLLINISNYKTTGYFKGTRLDSIDVKVAFCYYCCPYSDELDNYYFDAGQVQGKRRSNRFTNTEGHTLTFTSVASLINFLDYNGWSYSNTITGTPLGNDMEIVFTKK